MNRPFDATRYAGLLEGLEAAEIKLSEVLIDNAVFRFDAEYFGKSVLAAIRRLNTIGATRLGNVARVTDGIHESLPFIEDGPVRILSAKHPKDNYIDLTNYETISQSYHDKNPRTQLRTDDVLLSTVGTIGNAAVVTEDILPANSDRHIGIIRLKSGVMSPYYLAAFLVGLYGRAQSIREATGNVQLNLFISKIDQLLVPRFSAGFESHIAATVESAYEVRSFAATLLDAAELSLVTALGLANWQPPQPLSYVRRSRDAFAAGRLDAEYYAPRVVELLARLGTGGQHIRDVAPARHQRFVATRTGTFDYIEIGGLRADGTATAEPVAQADAPSRATWHVRANDVITSMVRPIRRLSALVAPEQDGSVCSSGFVVLEPKTVAPEVLLAYLRLPPVCELMDLHTSASLYPAISEADLLALPFPHIDQSVQTQVIAHVRTAQANRQRAADLLDDAKHAVEIAIEVSEAAALAWLQDARAHR